MTGHKASIIATVVVGILSAAVALYIHFDSPELDISGTIIEKLAEDPSNKKSAKTPTINISEVFITPIDTKMSSTFYAEVSNTGMASAEEFEVLVDFGESAIETCEWSPKSIAKTKESEALSLQILQVSSLKKDTSLYVTCSMNLPYFKKLWIGGGNIGFEKFIDYDAYKEMRLGEGISFYTGLWRALLIGFFALIFFKLVGFLFY
jgi:hypothetical protein